MGVQPAIHSLRFLPATLLVLIAAASLSGCASHQTVRTGGAQGYAALQSWRGSDRVEVTPINSAQAIGPAILAVAPVTVIPSGVEGVSDATVSKVTASLKTGLDEMARRLSAGSRTNVGGGTIEIRVSVTRIEEASPGLNALTTLMAAPLKNGAIALEAMAVDPGTGREVALMLWADEGKVRSIKGFGQNFDRSAHAVALSKNFVADLEQYLSPLARGGR